MKKLSAILIFCIFSFGTIGVGAFPDRAAARNGPPIKGRYHYFGGQVAYVARTLDTNGDTIPLVQLKTVFCFPRQADMTKYWKLVRDFRKVYPLALIARDKMGQLEDELLALPDRKSQREFIKRTEKGMVDEYTPVLKNMTVSQGRILVRLINRETQYTSYEIVKEFRGGFAASFWQGIARLFGHNLKDEYDSQDRDRIIEECIVLYNAGLLPDY